MTVLAVTRRPIVLETQASGAMLADLLARQETAIGRASLYGITDPVIAKLFTSESIEADFAGGVYRKGFVSSAAPANLPGWAFSRTGAGVAQSTGGGWEPFATGVPRITDRGLLTEPARTNLLTLTSGVPTTTTGLVKNGDAAATLSVIDVTAALRRDGFGDLIDAGLMNGNAYYLNNSAGTTDANVVLPGMTASTDIHSLSAVVAGSIGVTLRTGFTLPTGAAFALSGVYTRRSVSQASLDAGSLTSGDQMQITVPAGADVAFILPQMEPGTLAGSPIITAGAAATRGAEAASFTLSAPRRGGLFVEAEVPSLPSGEVGILAAWDNGSTDCLATIYVLSGALIFTVSENGSTIYTEGIAGVVPGQVVRAFLGWGDGVVVASADGTNLDDGSYVRSMRMNTVRAGSAFYGGEQARSYVRKLLTINYLPSPAERITMTGG